MHVRRWYCFVNRLAKASGLGVGIFGSVVFSFWRHRLVCPRAKTAHTSTRQDESSHVDPLVVTCGRDSVVSLCIEGFEIQFNSD